MTYHFASNNCVGAVLDASMGKRVDAAGVLQPDSAKARQGMMTSCLVLEIMSPSCDTRPNSASH